MPIVRIPTPLRPMAQGKDEVQVDGATVGDEETAILEVLTTASDDEARRLIATFGWQTLYDERDAAHEGGKADKLEDKLDKREDKLDKLDKTTLEPKVET